MDYWVIDLDFPLTLCSILWEKCKRITLVWVFEKNFKKKWIFPTFRAAGTVRWGGRDLGGCVSSIYFCCSFVEIKMVLCLCMAGHVPDVKCVTMLDMLVLNVSSFDWLERCTSKWNYPITRHEIKLMTYHFI